MEKHMDNGKTPCKITWVMDMIVKSKKTSALEHKLDLFRH